MKTSDFDFELPEELIAQHPFVGPIFFAINGFKPRAQNDQRQSLCQYPRSPSLRRRFGRQRIPCLTGTTFWHQRRNPCPFRVS